MGCALPKPARSRPNPAAPPERQGNNQPSNVHRYIPTQQGWPPWLMEVVGDAIQDWTPRRANTFEKLSKIGQGTYSNVYKARDLVSGKIVALKKVRFDHLEGESVKFMAREILVLKKLDHPNVVKLEGLVTSRICSSIYLVFEYMDHDLAGLVAGHGLNFTQPQIKCYMKQLLCGLEHCHSRGVLHRDIKGSNLLIDNQGILKIADFGLAAFYDSKQTRPMTNRVVTLWYRPPELLLGATFYGVGIDLWSAGCIFAELLAGKPIMPARTEVDQLHKIFKLCGSPSEDYWKKYRLQNATLYKPHHQYKRCILQTFKDFPSSSLPLIDTLLAIDPDHRGTTSAALNSQFFNTEPYACEPSSLPMYPPCKELDVKLRVKEATRQKALSGKAVAVDAATRVRARECALAIPESQTNLDRWRVVTNANAKSKSEKFPPPHQDEAVGYPLNASNRGTVLFGASDTSFGSKTSRTHGTSIAAAARPRPNSKGRTSNKADSKMVSSWKFMRAFKPTIVGLSSDLLFRRN